MPDLLNTALASGEVDGVQTGLTGAVTIQNVVGLTMVKTADQQSWADGALTYTVTIENAAGNDDYTDVVITDQLDAAIALVADSVQAGGVDLLETDYTYAANLLTINTIQGAAINVAGGETLTITFQVQKV